MTGTILCARMCSVFNNSAIVFCMGIRSKLKDKGSIQLIYQNRGYGVWIGLQSFN